MERRKLELKGLRKRCHGTAKAPKKAESRSLHNKAPRTTAQKPPEALQKALEQEPNVCRQELSPSVEAHLAASIQVEAKDEELSQLQSAHQPSLAKIKEQEQSKYPDKNSQPKTRRAMRTTRARTRAMSAVPEVHNDNFGKLGQTTRSHKKAAATRPDGSPVTTRGQRGSLETATGSRRHCSASVTVQHKANTAGTRHASRSSSHSC